MPFPLACVGLDDRFIWVNEAWSRLVGYSSAELKQKRWQDITKVEDVGGDQGSVKDIDAGTIEEYYLEKTYIRKNGAEIPIGLYVHRYPFQGDVECYIVAAQSIEDSSKMEIIHAQLAEFAARLERIESRWAWCQKFPPWLLKWWPVLVSIVAAVWAAVTWLIALLSTE